MKGLQVLALVALAGAAMPAEASRSEPRSAIKDYVRARAAAADGQAGDAARGFATVLAVNPADPVLATRAYRQAITAGDRALALTAARRLDAQAILPIDAQLLFVTQAVLDRNWTAALDAVAAVEKEKSLAFLTPSLRAWIAFGAGKGDPLTMLDARGGDALAAAYSGEQRALLLLASGRTADGIAAIRAGAISGGGRQMRMRMAAAALLARRGQRREALQMLEGDGAPWVAARKLIAAGGTLPGAIDSAAAGTAELLARVAVDINRERTTPIALGLARMATFLAPDNGETWLVAAELLLATGNVAASQAALDRISADDPFAARARDLRLSLLVRQGENVAALGVAESAAGRAGATAADWIRVGDVRVALSQPAAAAAAYGRAAKIAAPGAMWSAWLLQGSALEEAGEWAAAKTVLKRARKAAPDQAVVLNLLGYAQLERRENLIEAQQMIEQASRLRPDDASITDSLGWAYYLQGDLTKAIPALERAVVGDPAQSAINEHLGDAYWSAGRRFEARYAWAAALVGADAPDLSRIRTKIDGGWTRAVAAP